MKRSLPSSAGPTGSQGFLGRLNSCLNVGLPIQMRNGRVTSALSIDRAPPVFFQDKGSQPQEPNIPDEVKTPHMHEHGGGLISDGFLARGNEPVVQQDGLLSEVVKPLCQPIHLFSRFSTSSVMRYRASAASITCLNGEDACSQAFGLAF